jgi:hypothetical protein
LHSSYESCVRLHKLSVSCDTRLKLPSHLCLGSELLLAYHLSHLWHSPHLSIKNILKLSSGSSYFHALCSQYAQNPLLRNPHVLILGMKEQVSQTHKTACTYIHNCIEHNSFNMMSDNLAVEQSSPIFFSTRKKDSSVKQISATYSNRPPRMCLHINHCSIS